MNKILDIESEENFDIQKEIIFEQEEITNDFNIGLDIVKNSINFNEISEIIVSPLIGVYLMFAKILNSDIKIYRNILATTNFIKVIK